MVEDPKRLVIHKLVLDNFKSYAGTQEVGPFSHHFSAIVGPNGSGKSNLIDALLFVFGYRASKIRQTKVSDLIHASGQTIPDHCSVAVWFRPVDHEMNSEELVLERRAYPNNKSEYFVNGNPSTFTFVTNLLRDHGVDLDHHRFLILQGEIESIALMKPKKTGEHDDGLLEYLEDIIGSNKYKMLISEGLEEVKQLDEDCESHSRGIKLVEKELEMLQGPFSEAFRKLEDENEFLAKKSLYFQLKRLSSSQAMREIQQSLEEVNLAKEQVSRCIEKERAQLELDTEQHRAKSQEAHRLKQLLDLKKQMNGSCRKELAGHEETQKHARDKISRLEKQIAEDKSINSERSRLLENLETECQSKVAANPELEIQLKDVERELESHRKEFRSKTVEHQGRLEQLRAELSPLVEQHCGVIHELETNKTHLQQLDKWMRGRKECADKSQGLLRALEDKCREKESKVKELNKQHQKLEREKACMVESASKLEQLEKSLEEEVDRQKVEYLELKRVIDKDRGIDSVLDGLRQSGIQKIYGRLADLVHVDSRYQTAMSAACRSLDNIVVDRVDTGQRCIEYLKREGLRRATFIVLEKMKKPKHGKYPLERLFDCVKCTTKDAEPALYFVLGDTLVSKTLEEASNVAYGAIRHRVVTLDGQLIEKSGTMSAGTRAHGSVLIARKRVEKVQRERQINCSRLQETKQILRECRDRLGEYEMEEQKLVAEIRRMGDELELDEQKREELLKMTSVDQGEEENQEITIPTEELEARQVELEQKIDRIKTEIRKEESKILQMEGLQFRSTNERAIEIRERIERNQNRIGQLLGEIRGIKRFLSDQDRIQKQSETQLAKLLHEKRELDMEIDRLNRVVQDVQKEQEGMQQEYQEIRTEVDKLERQTDGIRVQMGASRTRMDEIENQIEKLRNILCDLTDTHQASLREIDRISLHGKTLKLCTEDELKRNLGQMNRLEQELQKRRERGAMDIRQCVEIIEGYNATQARLKVLEEQGQQLGESLEEKRRIHDEHKRKRLETFMRGFTSISGKLKEIYRAITLGGNAELEFVDSLDPFSEGILFTVMPPRKAWKNISDLSGGEKTLSSLALVFALHHYRPTPVYVMDEIDAALDVRNTLIIANYIRTQTQNHAQFVVISLRSQMFEQADSLTGIYKLGQCTQSATLCLLPMTAFAHV